MRKPVRITGLACHPRYPVLQSAGMRDTATVPSWLRLVRTLAAAGDGVEGLAEVVGERVGGGEGLPSGLDLDGAVAARGLHVFPD
jgi:hypothetical protein